MAGNKRGPNKEPTALKMLKGNPGKRPIIKEIKPNPYMPVMPDWLEDEAKAEWERMAPKLEKMGLLTEVDGAALSGYCQAYARWKEAEEFIKKHGLVFKTPSGYIQQVPHVSIAQKYLQIMNAFLSKFGMSPSDRVGLADPKANEKKSKLSGLLSG